MILFVGAFDKSMRWKVRSKAVIHELLEDEIILADLDTGIYFSIRGSGIPLWQLVCAGFSMEEMRACFQEKYGVDASGALNGFIDRLLQEQLLVEESEDPEAVLPSDLFWPARFDAPSLEKHAEMQNLLMLDPIHEVDEQGWPIRK